MQAAFKGPEISIHALLAESDGPRCKGPWACFPFLSTLSLRRATIRPHQRHFAADISIHALLAESDEAEDGYKDTVTEFLSTLSLRRATVEEVSGDTWTRDFYPRSPCGERPRLATRSRHYPMDFYPRSPCGERHDTSSLMQCQAKFLSTLSLRRATVIFRKRDTPSQFLSTLSLRRATIQVMARLMEHLFLSTLSLRRATGKLARCNCQQHHFYPRSPCGERLFHRYCYAASTRFLSTLSLRRATGKYIPYPATWLFLSTLSLRRATAHCFMSSKINTNFYPRSPCGERHTRNGTSWAMPYFYPRSPCGERLDPESLRPTAKWISIHALLAESDYLCLLACYQVGLFLSTLSLRRATNPAGQSLQSTCISIHALLAESDDHLGLVAPPNAKISIHALLAESDYRKPA